MKRRLCLLSLIAFFALPQIAAADEIAWSDVPDAIMKQHLVNDCEGPDSNILAPITPERFSLAAKVDLFLVPCQLGAYNAVSRLYVRHSEGEPWIDPLFFADYWREVGWRGTDRLINASFDPKTGTLSMLAKSRGVGDCGSAGDWVWTENGFKMKEFRYWGTCDGTRFPDQWPVIYKSLD